jgi:hypothetical protein
MPVQGIVPKSSPAPRDNSFDCSLNRHEITVYSFNIGKHKNDHDMYSESYFDLLGPLG